MYPQSIEDRKSKIKRLIEKMINDNQLENAKDSISDYEKIDKDDTDILSMKAVIYIMENKLNEAEKTLIHGLEQDYSNFDLLYNLGYVYEQKSNYTEALRYYKESLSNCSDNSIIENLNIIIETIMQNHKDEINENRQKLAFFVKKGMDSFLHDIIQSLSIDYEVRKIVVTEYHQIDEGMQWADICWFEWCDELVIYGSKLHLAYSKKIICRLHSYEAFTDYPSKVDWDNVDKLIFVSEHLRDLINEKFKIGINKTEVIANGINIKKWAFTKRRPNFNIAYVGYINYKKGPMLLIHTFKAIYNKDHRYKLYIAGQFQDERDILYFKQMIKEFGIENNVFFEGWQDNLDKWLEDKNYILCTSVLESQNVSVMQAMAKGIKPIIHNFVGAKEIYSSHYIWNTIDEAIDMIFEENYDSNEYRNFICNNYSLDLQIIKANELLKKLNIIKKIDTDEFYKSKLIEHFEINVDNIENTERLFQYLIDYEDEEEYMYYIGKWFIKSQYDLTSRFNYYYSNMYRSFKTYDRFKYINNECYEEMNNISIELAEYFHIKPLKTKENKIVLFSTGLDIKQGINKFVTNLAKTKLQEFEIILVSILPKEGFNNFEISIKELEKNNIKYFIPKSHEIVERTKEILKYIEEISPLYVIYQSFYFAPTSILLFHSLKNMKIKIGSFIFQQPEAYFHNKIDFIVSFGFDYPDLITKNDFRYYIPVENERIDNYLDIRKDFKIEDNKIVIASIGRSIKYNNHDFWKYVCKCVKSEEKFCFVFFGLNYEEYSHWIDRELVDLKKIIFAGFSLSASRYLKSCNAYLNSPLSGGIALSEAYYADVPIITGYNRNIVIKGNVNDIAEMYPSRFFRDNNIYPRCGDYEGLYEFTQRLFSDNIFPNEINKIKKIDKRELTHKNFALGLIKFLNENVK